MSPSTNPPQTSDNRDIGLGTALFNQTYRSPTDNRDYSTYARLPILGYCPGCSSKAHLNFKNSDVGVFHGGLGSVSGAAFSVFEEEEGEAHDVEPIDEGVLVNIETHHSGPSYAYDDGYPSEPEIRRIRLVRYMLKQWSRACSAQSSSQGVEQARREAVQEEERHIASKARYDDGIEQDEMLENAYASGNVYMSGTESARDAGLKRVVGEMGVVTKAEDRVTKAGKINVSSVTKKAGVGLGLVSYEDADGGEGLVGYESDEDVEM